MALCTVCGCVVDKYVEYDLVIISLDVLLLKRPAFRHIMINTRIQSPWKFCLVMLICEALIKLMNDPASKDRKAWKSDNVIYTALEVDLYWNFIASAIELFSFVSGVLFCLSVMKSFQGSKYNVPSNLECACGLMLSCLGKILVLPAVLWGQNYSVLYTWLVDLFTLAANIQALVVLYPHWHRYALSFCVLFAYVISCGTAIGLRHLKTAIT